MAFSDTVTR